MEKSQFDIKNVIILLVDLSCLRFTYRNFSHRAIIYLSTLYMRETIARA